MNKRTKIHSVLLAVLLISMLLGGCEQLKLPSSPVIFDPPNMDKINEVTGKLNERNLVPDVPVTPTIKPIATLTPEKKFMPIMTAIPTKTPMPSPEAVPTKSVVIIVVPTKTPGVSDGHLVVSATLTPTITPTPTVEVTAPPVATMKPIKVTDTPGVTPIPTATQTPTSTPTPAATSTPTPSPTPTQYALPQPVGSGDSYRYNSTDGEVITLNYDNGASLIIYRYNNHTTKVEATYPYDRTAKHGGIKEGSVDTEGVARLYYWDGYFCYIPKNGTPEWYDQQRRSVNE